MADTPPERVRTFFGVDGRRAGLQDRLDSRAGRRRLEIFEFQPQLPPARRPVEPRRPDAHQLQRAETLQKWYDYLSSKGVECVSRSPSDRRAGHTFFFAKDFDGNLIELMDLGYMYTCSSGWVRSAGWLFRRGMYKKYYEINRQLTGPEPSAPAAPHVWIPRPEPPHLLADLQRVREDGARPG